VEEGNSIIMRSERKKMPRKIMRDSRANILMPEDMSGRASEIDPLDGNVWQVH
jgi:hypothetical protein